MILVIGGSFQGKKAYAAQICGGGTVLADFQDRIRAALEAGEDPEAFTRQILVNPPAVITLDEVGCGIVPMEKSERDYREAVGHAGTDVSGSGSRGLPGAVRHCGPDQIKRQKECKAA